MTSNDHFFGQVEISSRTGEAILSLPLAQLVGRDHFTTQLRRLLTFMGTLRLLTVPQRQTLQPCCSTCYKSKLVMPA